MFKQFQTQLSPDLTNACQIHWGSATFGGATCGLWRGPTWGEGLVWVYPTQATGRVQDMGWAQIDHEAQHCGEGMVLGLGGALNVTGRYITIKWSPLVIGIWKASLCTADPNNRSKKARIESNNGVSRVQKTVDKQ